MSPPGVSTYLDWRAVPDQAALPPPALPEGRRSFGCPNRAKAKGALHCAGGGLLQSVRDLLPVAAAMVKGSKPEGPIPAGYTYLGQLLAHDLCSASEGVFDYPLQGQAVPVTQPRPRQMLPLHLETLLGPIAALGPSPDLWRFAPASALFPLFSADLRRVWAPQAVGRRAALVPDSRNDDTPMIAQLSAVFIELAARLTAALRAADLPPDAARQGGRVQAARIWHRILQQDYLPRLCLTGLADLAPDHQAPRHAPLAIPVELTHAVLRCGHWMVRSQYRLNGETVTIADLMAGIDDLEARRRRPGSGDFWRIDWRNFFELDPKHPPQRALALGGGIAAMFGSDHVLPEGIEIHAALVSSDNDLALRDLTRSMDGGLQRVSMLARRLAPRLKAQFPDWALWSATARKGMVRAWCAKAGCDAPGHLSDDPPLYLYLLAEAGAGDTAQGFGNGQSLGALGSALLAASVNGAVACSARMLPAAPETEPAISTLPDLIRFLS